MPIGAYRDQEEERRKVRNAEKDRQKSSLLARLAESKRKNRKGAAEGDADDDDDFNQSSGSGEEATDGELTSAQNQVHFLEPPSGVTHDIF